MGYRIVGCVRVASDYYTLSPSFPARAEKCLEIKYVQRLCRGLLLPKTSLTSVIRE